jgi:hypothetical protein
MRTDYAFIAVFALGLVGFLTLGAVVWIMA